MHPVRKRLLQMDLADLRAKRAPVGRTALQHRVRSILRSKRAQQVARNYVRSLRKVCQEVKARGGRASSG